MRTRQNRFLPTNTELRVSDLAQGELRLKRLFEAANNAGVEVVIEHWPGDPMLPLAFSEFVAESLIRHPQWIPTMLESGGAVHHANRDYAALAQCLVEQHEDLDQLAIALREFRTREAIRIAWRDICGVSDFEQTTEQLTKLADQILRISVAAIERSLVAQYGEPTDQDDQRVAPVVLALGKLGAGELNFSSDIDLILCYAQDGLTRNGRREEDNQSWFNRLARKLVSVLSERNAHGYVYRVDLRLRPFGSAGPLSMSFAQMESYYETHGRDWERYALIRARPVAGDLTRGAQLIRLLRPFVYRRYIDFGTLESMREMKRLIAADVERRDLGAHVKLGPGGIREIEFTVQAFQLAEGGRNHSLQHREVLVVLERLREFGRLSTEEVEDLGDCYRFLRTVEHRLQQVADQQTHTLPSVDAAREALASALGFDDWAALEQRLNAARAIVRSHFDKVLGESDSNNEHQASSHFAIQLTEFDEDQQWPAEAVRELGFDSPQDVKAALQGLLQSHPAKAMDDISRRRTLALLPRLLEVIGGKTQIGKSGQSAGKPTPPPETLRRILPIVKTILRRSVYLSLLTERDIALHQLVSLCAASPWISLELERHPVLLDELLDPGTLVATASRAALSVELEGQLSGHVGDTEAQMANLREFTQAQVFRVAAADISGVLPIAKVSDQLTFVAEAVIEQAMCLAVEDISLRYGRLWFESAVDNEASEAKRSLHGLLVVGYGKLGGWELGYGSDLDLVFLHDANARSFDDLSFRPAHASAAQGSSQRRKSVDTLTYMARVVQRFIHHCSTRTPQGRCYEVDTRLRPNGNSGLLSNTLAAFESYLVNNAWTWELQSLVRARPVAGDDALFEAFSEMRIRVLRSPRDPRKLRQDVASMRERMLNELGNRDPLIFDIKRDQGGIADIEFIVQYLTLRYASSLGDWLRWSDNLRLLEGMSALEILPSSEASALIELYLSYRNRIHRLSLQEQDAIVDSGEYTVEREQIRSIWRRVFEENSHGS